MVIRSPSRFLNYALATCSAFLLGVTSSQGLAPNSNTKREKIHRDLLKIYQAKQYVTLATEEFEALIKLKPKEPDLRIEYGRFLASSGQRGLALEQFNQACRLAPGNREYLTILKQFETRPVVRITTSHIVLDENIERQQLAQAVNDRGERRSLCGHTGRKLAAIARRPGTIANLGIEAVYAEIAVVHEKRNDIVFFANYPEHWADRGNTVLQIGVSRSTPGIFVTANGEIVYGPGVYQIGPDSITINGVVFDSSPGSCGVRFARDGIYLGNRKMRSGPLDPTNKEEPDIVQIAVPMEYKGGTETLPNNTCQPICDSQPQ